MTASQATLVTLSNLKCYGVGSVLMGQLLIFSLSDLRDVQKLFLLLLLDKLYAQIVSMVFKLVHNLKLGRTVSTLVDRLRKQSDLEEQDHKNKQKCHLRASTFRKVKCTAYLQADSSLEEYLDIEHKLNMNQQPPQKSDIIIKCACESLTDGEDFFPL